MSKYIYFWKHNNTYYKSISDIAKRLVGTKAEIEELDNEWRIFVDVYTKQKLVNLNADLLMCFLQDFSKDITIGDISSKEYTKLISTFNKNINFKKINTKIPKMYKIFLDNKKITKKMLLRSLKK